MISALGYCEDPACSQSSSNHELVRLFRCSIHCDHLLCLFHLNAHNVYYEEAKKQNDVVLDELQTNLTLYQTIFEKHLQEYRDIVHQASTLLLHNSSAIIPVEKIRPVAERLQRAIHIFQHNQVIVKSEQVLDMTDFDSIVLKDLPPIKNESLTPEKVPSEPSQKVVVRLQRVDCNKEPQLNVDGINRKDEITVDSSQYVSDENQSENNKRGRSAKVKKTTTLKRLQT